MYFLEHVTLDLFRHHISLQTGIRSAVCEDSHEQKGLATLPSGPWRKLKQMISIFYKT